MGIGAREAAVIMPVMAALPAAAQQPAIVIEVGHNMRPVNEVIVHCSATPAGRDVDAAEIRRWHLQRKFKDIGYHYVVKLDGTIEPGRPLGQQGAHCLGHNARSIGVCYVGGCDEAMRPADTRTPAQRAALTALLQALKRLFPDAVIRGHRDFAAKACPSFDATAEYESIK